MAPTSRYVESGLRGAANTVKAYASGWQRFTAWCQAHDLVPLPVTVETLASSGTELVEVGKKIATVQCLLLVVGPQLGHHVREVV